MDVVSANANKVAPSREDSDVSTSITGLIGLFGNEGETRPVEANDTAGLLQACKDWLHRYVVITSEQGHVLAAWILHTWAIDAAECTPYLHITAPEKGSGKSRLLEALEHVVKGACRTGGMTAAALIRTVDTESPTLLLDEVDAAFGGDKEVVEAIRGILNEGYRRGGNFRKVEGKNHELRIFKVFGAKALAGIGKVPDTVASRSIVIEMRRKTAAETVEPLRIRDVKEAARPLRASLEAWAASGVIATLERARPTPPKGATDRQADISEPLLAIADLAGKKWPVAVRHSLETLFRSASSEDASWEVTLLRDLRAFLTGDSYSRADSIFSVDLVAALRELEESPWAEWDKGQGLKPTGLAKLLKKYGIVPGSIRVGSVTAKGYKRSAFVDTWERYLPRTGDEAVTSVTTRATIEDSTVFGAVTNTNVTDTESSRNPHKQRVVTAVTAVTALRDAEAQDQPFVEGRI